MNKSLLQGSLAKTEAAKFPFQRHRRGSRRSDVNTERRVTPVVGEEDGRARGRRFRGGKAGCNACTRHALALICYRTTHLFTTTAYENTPFEECNQRCLGSRDSRACLHLAVQTKSFFRAAGGRQPRFRKAPPRRRAHALQSSQLPAPMCDNMMFVESRYECLQ